MDPGCGSPCEQRASGAVRPTYSSLALPANRTAAVLLPPRRRPATRRMQDRPPSHNTTGLGRGAAGPDRRQSWVMQSPATTPQSCCAPIINLLRGAARHRDDRRRRSHRGRRDPGHPTTITTPSARSATQVSAPSPAGSTRYDGGPEEGTRVVPSRLPGVRYDGGPEEGTATLAAALGTRDVRS